MTVTEVKYPVFLECAEYTLDDFWIHQFTQLAKGHSPKSVRLYEDHITVYLGKERVYFRYDDPASLTNDVIRTFWKLGIMSKNDEKEYNENVIQIRTTIKESMKEWRKIKSKSIKKSLISNYVQNLPYSVVDRMEIYTLLNMHLAFNNLSNTNVTIKDGQITDIDGLEFDEDTNEWTFNPF